MLMNDSLKRDFCISKPKIAVLGLNPHAGDEGLIGKEEIEMIKRALVKNHGKRKKAADELGISERTLYRKIKQYELED